MTMNCPKHLPAKAIIALLAIVLSLGAGLACCSPSDLSNLPSDLRDWSYHRKMCSLLDDYGEAYDVKQDYTAAVSIAKEMVKRSVAHGGEAEFSHRHALLRLGHTLAKAGMRDEAVDTLEKMLAIYQRHPDITKDDYIHGRATELLASLREEVSEASGEAS